MLSYNDGIAYTYIVTNVRNYWMLNVTNLQVNITSIVFHAYREKKNVTGVGDSFGENGKILRGKEDGMVGLIFELG